MAERGRILKILGGFYYLMTETGDVLESRARGVLRHQEITPLVGDYVAFRRGDEGTLAYVEEVIDRKNALERPPVANIDQVLLLIPVRKPRYNLFLIDKLLVHYEKIGIEVYIGIAKSDLHEKEAEKINTIYDEAGFVTKKISIHDPSSKYWIQEIMKGKTTAFSGVSGAGKSSWTNELLGLELKTGEVSKKGNRGKHTTRHTELLRSKEGWYLFDTPGFSSIDVDEIPSYELRHYFREFQKPAETCQFQDCLHMNEPGCRVREQVSKKKIAQSRYENYKRLYAELDEKERREWR